MKKESNKKEELSLKDLQEKYRELSALDREDINVGGYIANKIKSLQNSQKEYSRARQFLKEKKMIAQGFNTFTITGSFGIVDLGILLDEYADSFLEKIKHLETEQQENHAEIGDIISQNNYLKKENERLREALEFNNQRLLWIMAMSSYMLGENAVQIHGWAKESLKGG